MGKSILAVLFAVIAVLVTTDGYADRAASIEYDFIARPPPSFEDAPAGITLRFLAIKAIDGFGVEAALWACRQNGNRYHVDPAAILPAPAWCPRPGNRSEGYAMLNVKTRHYDKRGNTDN